MKRAIYVDYENVNISGLKGIEELTHEDVVKIFIGAQTSKLTMVDANRIFNCEASVELITNKYIGKNALDFIIMVHMGYDIALGLAKSYYIISKDKGYDPAIHEMRKMSGLTVARREDITAVLDVKQGLGSKIKGLFGIGKVKETPDTTEHTVVGKGRKDSDEISRIAKDYVKEDSPKSGKRSGKKARDKKTQIKETKEPKPKDYKAKEPTEPKSKDYKAKEPTEPKSKDYKAKEPTESKSKDYKAKEPTESKTGNYKSKGSAGTKPRDYKGKEPAVTETERKNGKEQAPHSENLNEKQPNTGAGNPSKRQPNTGAGNPSKRQNEKNTSGTNNKNAERTAGRQSAANSGKSVNMQSGANAEEPTKIIPETSDRTISDTVSDVKPDTDAGANLSENGMQKNNAPETKDTQKETLPAVRKNYSLTEQKSETAFTAKPNENSDAAPKSSGDKKNVQRHKNADGKQADADKSGRNGQHANERNSADGDKSANEKKSGNGRNRNASKGKTNPNDAKTSASREVIPAAETAQDFLIEPTETEATALNESTRSDSKSEGGRKNNGRSKNYNGKNHRKASAGGDEDIRQKSGSDNKNDGQNIQTEADSVNHLPEENIAAETELERQRREAFALLAELEEEEKQETKFVYKKRR